MRYSDGPRRRVVILGAGASRSVSYAGTARYRSPLNTDFFDLLQQRLYGSREKKIKAAITRVLERVAKLPADYWRSMERSFYTLHLRAYLAEKLGKPLRDSDTRVIEDFAISIQALLRFAHEKYVCAYHAAVFEALTHGDSIVTFNYDLVPERALRGILEKRAVEFGAWLYGLKLRLGAAYGPTLLKLHGSSNWKLDRATPSPIQKKWSDFDKEYGYRGDRGEGSVFPIFLPFWDKRIEQRPWIKLWTNASDKLQRATEVIAWGYSLPATDIKAQQLFDLTLGRSRSAPLRLCVVDPAEDVRLRWRRLIPGALFWEYQSIEEFLSHPPRWWRANSK